MSHRVLVVDDSATIRRVVRRTLADAGYEVVLAAGGREALEHAQGAPPDLVLVDFVMPQMNGFQLCQALRAIANLASVPIVLMSAKADRISDGFLAQTGALDAIAKPFAPEALLAVTSHALARASQRPDEPVAIEEAPPERLSRPPPEPPTREISPDALAKAAAAIVARIGDSQLLLPTWEPAKVFELVAELAALTPGGDGEIALFGRIDHVPLGEILQLLQHQQQSGVLAVERAGEPRRSVSICLRGGAVDLAVGHSREEGLRLGRYLVREGLVERAELERIVRARGSSSSLLGSHLIKLGLISQDDLTHALVQQTSELIYDALRWRRGKYRFLRFASRPEAEDARLGLPLAAILMEGLRRVDEWRLIAEQIESFDDVPRRDEESLRGVDRERLSGEERAVLDLVDGERTIREIVDRAAMGSFEVCKILFQMLTSRLLRVR